MIDRHTIYGLKHKGRIIYVGCTKHHPERISAVTGVNPSLKSIRKEIEPIVLAVANTKWNGQTKETFLIIKLFEQGEPLLNKTPSKTVSALNRDGLISEKSWKETKIGKHFQAIRTRRDASKRLKKEIETLRSKLALAINKLKPTKK